MNPEPRSRHTPAHNCGPKKSDLDLGCPVIGVCLSIAPAIGEPIKLANEDMPQLMPVLVPKRLRSEQSDGNTAAGSVTSPALQKPQNTAHAMSPDSVLTDIHDSETMPEDAAHQNHVKIGPSLNATMPETKRPRKDAAIAITNMFNDMF
jgi:hypothetical protein